MRECCAAPHPSSRAIIPGAGTQIYSALLLYNKRSRSLKLMHTGPGLLVGAWERTFWRKIRRNGRLACRFSHTSGLITRTGPHTWRTCMIAYHSVAHPLFMRAQTNSLPLPKTLNDRYIPEYRQKSIAKQKACTWQHRNRTPL